MLEAPLQVALSVDKTGILLAVRVKPRGRSNAVLGARGDALLVSVTAAPVDGAANAAVVEVLAGVLRLSKSCISVARGHKTREKVVHLSGLTIDDMRARLASLS